MSILRQCVRSGCSNTAAASLTYDYGDSTIVLGPLATSAEPHAYDLCVHHANTLSAPKGWQIVRLATEYVEAPPSEDDLTALADAVREAAHSRPVDPPPARREPRRVSNSDFEDGEISRRGHLRVLRGDAEDSLTEE